MKLEATKRLKAKPRAGVYHLRNGIGLHVADADENLLTFEASKVDFEQLRDTLTLFTKLSPMNVDAYGFVADTPNELLAILKQAYRSVPVSSESVLTKTFSPSFAQNYLRYVGGLHEAISTLQELTS